MWRVASLSMAVHARGTGSRETSWAPPLLPLHDLSQQGGGTFAKAEQSTPLTEADACALLEHDK